MSQRIGVRAQGLPATLDLASLMTNQGMLIEGAVAGDIAGWAVASAGDVNGDGLSDLLVGANKASPLGRSYTGAAYVIYGSRTLPPVLDLSALNSSQGIVIQGAVENDNAGNSVASAGDVNGDGKSDFLVGARYASPAGRNQAGAVYLIYGATNLSSTIDLGNLTANQGVVLQGGAAGDYTACSVASAGDVNGDGLSDLLIGAYYASPAGRCGARMAYLIYGGANLPSTIDLGNLTSTQGVVLQGVATHALAGDLVASARDMNGNGGIDILVRVPSVGVYVVYGSPSVATTTLETPSLTIALTTTKATTTQTMGSPTQSLTTPAVIRTTSIANSQSGSDLLTTVQSITASLTIQPIATTGSSLSAETSNAPTTYSKGSSATPIKSTVPTSTSPATSIVPLIVGVSGGSFSFAACLGAIGFYAYRKKNHPNQSNNPASNNDNVALKDKNSAAAQPNYGKIDATKKNEKEYDEIPKLEI